eukprot:351126-Chlamydomonas_euryale.AAC.3
MHLLRALLGCMMPSENHGQCVLYAASAGSTQDGMDGCQLLLGRGDLQPWPLLLCTTCPFPSKGSWRAALRHASCFRQAAGASMQNQATAGDRGINAKTGDGRPRGPACEGTTRQ